MRFKVKDYRGNVYSVKESLTDADKEIKAPEDSELTADEIVALKKLIKKIPDLLDLLDVEAEEHKKDDKKDAGKTVEKPKDEKKSLAEDELEVKGDKDTDGEDEDFGAEEKEEIVTDNDPDAECKDCDDTMIHDSRSSFGAIEHKTDDSVEVEKDDEIAEAWSKRYGGK
jgi:hypothetical protein